MSEDRESWSSRPAFILAAVGAAVGFGNIWRFPALAYEYGGGAFFIPYLLALFLFGLPLLLLELALGQHLQTGDVGVFGSIDKRLRGVGLIAVICGFVVTGYYVPLLAWVLKVFVESFGYMSESWDDISSEDASDYFFNHVVGQESLGDDGLPTRIVGENVMYLMISWLSVGLCIAFGVKWTGRIAYFTMGVPIILLLVFFVRAVTLEGAGEGIQSYIGQWDMTVLAERPDVWSTAVSQIFFSLGTTFGVLTAFGSHCPPGSPATENAYIIGFSNSAFSFIAGFAVFGSLGYLKEYEDADDIADVATAGPGLIFGALPAVLSTLPGGIHLVRVLFFTLFLLGLDSAFGFTEAIITVIKDSELGKDKNPKIITGAVCFLGFLSGIIYTSDAGLTFLGSVDFYVNFAMILIGFCKAFSAGWIYGLEDQLATFGSKIVYGYMLTTFGSVIITCITWFWIPHDTEIFGFLLLLLFYGLGMLKCSKEIKDFVAHNPDRGFTVKTALCELSMGNILQLKADLESSVGKIPVVWPYLIKHFIPQTLLVLFFNLTGSRNELGETVFGHYEAYPFPFQMVGIFVVVFVLIIFSIGVKRPETLDKIASLGEKPMAHNAKGTEDRFDTVYVEMPAK